MMKILFALLFAVTVLSAAEITGRVVAVSDGDTITVLDDLDKQKMKIRLAGIDAPEKRQAYGEQARAYLAGMVEKQHVRIRFTEADRYGRIVGRVWLGKMDVNKEMLLAGFAWHYTAYDRSRELADAEQEARRRGIGLWKSKNPVNPAEYRKQQKRRTDNEEMVQ